MVLMQVVCSLCEGVSHMALAVRTLAQCTPPAEGSETLVRLQNVT